MRSLASFFEQKATENSRLNDSHFVNKSCRSNKCDLSINKSPQSPKKVNKTVSPFTIDDCIIEERVSLPNEKIFDTEVVSEIERVKSMTVCDIRGLIEMYEKNVSEKNEGRTSHRERIKEVNKRTTRSYTIAEERRNICFKNRFKKTLKKFRSSKNSEIKRINNSEPKSKYFSKSEQHIQHPDKVNNEESSEDSYISKSSKRDSINKSILNISNSQITNNVVYNLVIKNEIHNQIQNTINIYDNTINSQTDNNETNNVDDKKDIIETAETENNVEEINEKCLTASDILKCYNNITFAIEYLSEEQKIKNIDNNDRIFEYKKTRYFLCMFFLLYKNTILNRLLKRCNVNN